MWKGLLLHNHCAAILENNAELGSVPVLIFHFPAKARDTKADSKGFMYT